MAPTNPTNQITGDILTILYCVATWYLFVKTVSLVVAFLFIEICSTPRSTRKRQKKRRGMMAPRAALFPSLSLSFSTHVVARRFLDRDCSRPRHRDRCAGINQKSTVEGAIPIPIPLRSISDSMHPLLSPSPSPLRIRQSRLTNVSKALTSE